MDMSKLPRLSNSQAQRAAEAGAADSGPIPEAALATGPARSPISHSDAPDARGADVWISIAVGVILLLMYPRFLQWASHRLFSTSFNPFLAPDGTVVPYTQVPEFWADLGPTLFGVVLVVEGIALALARRRAVLIGVFALTLLGTGYNLVYLVMSFGKYGLAIVSAVAVAFGVYIAAGQWQEIRRSAPPSARA